MQLLHPSHPCREHNVHALARPSLRATVQHLGLWLARRASLNPLRPTLSVPVRPYSLSLCLALPGTPAPSAPVTLGLAPAPALTLSPFSNIVSILVPLKPRV